MALRRPNLNFKSGRNTTASIVDNSTLDAVDVTYDAIARELLITWSGRTPTVAGAGLEAFVPVFGGTFTLISAKSRLSILPVGSTAFRIEKSAGGSSAFSAATVTTLTHTTSDYEKTDLALSGTVAAGSLLRIYFATMNPSGGTFQVQLRATEA
jgi:hypothetical protein